MADDALAHDGKDLSRRLRRRHYGSRILHFAGHHAWHHHGVLSLYCRAHRSLRELPDPASDRGARHGVSIPECTVVLDLPAVMHRDLFGTLCDERSTDGRMDSLR